MTSGTDISVIVPTFNRRASLQRLLESMDLLELPNAVRAEVVIVDNSSTDNTEELLRQKEGQEKRFSFRVLKEDRKGKSSALNRGIASAQGQILIIVDDDVVVHPEWMIKHWECHRGIEFDVVQGRVLPGVDDQGNPADGNRAREYNIPVVDYGKESCAIRGFTGTNVSFKREIFDKIGLFDPRLGPGAAGFSEDSEFSLRLGRAGFRIGYVPDAIVYHELNPGRYGREYNRMIEYRKGVSRSIYRRESILFRVIPDLLINCLRYGIYTALGLTQKAYKTEGRIMKCWGYLTGKMRSVGVTRSGTGR
jgi:glucosyl-dolichyl phosphate glucuronosyltransferase